MNAIRARLIAYAVALVVCHASLLLVAPMALCSFDRDLAAAEETTVCTCASHTAGAPCPMHTGSTGHADGKDGTVPNDTRCCPVSSDPARLALAMLANPTGVPVDRSQFVRPDASTAPMIAIAAALVALDRPPTSPPPRA